MEHAQALGAGVHHSLADCESQREADGERRDGPGVVARQSPPDTAAATHVGRPEQGGDQATAKRAQMVHSARVQWALLARRRDG